MADEYIFSQRRNNGGRAYTLWHACYTFLPKLNTYSTPTVVKWLFMQNMFSRVAVYVNRIFCIFYLCGGKALLKIKTCSTFTGKNQLCAKNISAHLVGQHDPSTKHIFHPGGTI
jgi:hypothetical protein